MFCLLPTALLFCLWGRLEDVGSAGNRSSGLGAARIGNKRRQSHFTAARGNNSATRLWVEQKLSAQNSGPGIPAPDCCFLWETAHRISYLPIETIPEALMKARVPNLPVRGPMDSKTWAVPQVSQYMDRGRENWAGCYRYA